MAGVEGAVAFVTGGASGIGEACVRMLHARGARVMIADRDGAGAARLAAELGDGASSCELDVAEPASTEVAVGATIDRFGSLTAAVNSAGVGVPAVVSVGELDFAEWRRVLDVNLDGVFNSMHSELRAMTSGGSIINISSVMGVVGTVGASAYVAAKHGVVGLTKAAALEYADRGIRVNAVGPGHIRTPMFTRRTAEQQAEVASEYPVGRVGEPDEIANFVCFLAGSEARFATGGFYAVDGGFTAR